MAHVLAEQLAEGIELLALGGRSPLRVGGSAPDLDVIREHPDDGGIRRVDIRGGAGQQDVLLDAEVAAAVSPPELKKLRGHLLGVGFDGPPQLARGLQGAMVPSRG